MLFRYFLKHLLLPPGGLLLLLVLGWLLRFCCPRLGLFCFGLGVGGLWVMAMPLSVQWCARWLEPAHSQALGPEQWPALMGRAEVIVVLGGGRTLGDPAWGRDQPSFLALERLRYGGRLARASGLPLLVSGGRHFGQRASEAELAQEVLQMDYGGLMVRWREEASRTTWENAVNVATVLRSEGIKRVVLVTQAFHMRRALWCFEQQGLEVVMAPLGFWGGNHGRPGWGLLPEGRAFWQMSVLLNEWAGLLLYPRLYP